MNGMTATQRYTATDYQSFTRRRDGVSSTLGPPWYPDDGPRRPTNDPTRSLLLDIPARSPGRPGPAPRNAGQRPPSTGGPQPLLSVAPPQPPQPQPPPPIEDASAINPQLRHAQKTGDLYKISVNLNALQMAARSVDVTPSVHIHGEGSLSLSVNQGPKPKARRAGVRFLGRGTGSPLPELGG